MIRTLLLVRHGRTAWNLEGRLQGHADVALDDVGREQADALGAGLAPLGPARLWSSDLRRAEATASVIGAACALPVVPDPRLREYDVGARSGLTPAEFAEQYPEEHAAWNAGAPGPLVPGEEGAAEVAARTSTALREHMASLAPGEIGVAVMHGACIKTALGALLDWPGARRALAGLDNGAIAVLVDRGPELRLVAYNVPPAGVAALAPDFASRTAAR